MNLAALKPQALAILDYWEGDVNALLHMHSDDGEVMSVPASYYFREHQGWPMVEQTAVDLCRGRVLDAGAGTGCHSLVLQQRGLDVTAIDILPECVQVMRERGVVNAVLADVFRYQDEPLDTILMLMNGIGFVQDLKGMERLLSGIGRLLKPGGQLLFDSSDGRHDVKPEDPKSIEIDLDKSPYFGEVELWLEYRGIIGENFKWLYVDTDTLTLIANRCGWSTNIIEMDEEGLYLAQLTKSE
ncbi:class I SAM-dependent methyltransferase [bacterium]|nr:class I SAM-dependent methyltransferase [bacterium]MBU1651545.1 class I SAM-dependent methyltransferase [bacterium]